MRRKEIYIANDGRRFDSQNECEAYEESLKILSGMDMDLCNLFKTFDEFGKILEIPTVVKEFFYCTLNEVQMKNYLQTNCYVLEKIYDFFKKVKGIKILYRTEKEFKNIITMANKIFKEIYIDISDAPNMEIYNEIDDKDIYIIDNKKYVVFHFLEFDEFTTGFFTKNVILRYFNGITNGQFT